MSCINGKILKELREKKKLTQKQLGKLISVSDKTVSKWETEKGLPEPLSSGLGVSVAELLFCALSSQKIKVLFSSATEMGFLNFRYKYFL